MSAGAREPRPSWRSCSYVLPLRLAGGRDHDRGELRDYLRELSGWCEDVILVDGSPPEVLAENRQSWDGLVRHVALPAERVTPMGKVGGVLLGLELARHDRVVVADDDVRYDHAALGRLVGLLDSHDVVAPQNYFDPRPWHALWDTPRTLLNRAVGTDFPGTLGLRRSRLLAAGGYDGAVLFENLELIRTIEAHGGRVAAPLDLYVRRLPPATAHFFGQRVRQAYDDFAQPGRMALWLAIVPCGAASVAARRPWLLAAFGVASMAVAERGRRREGGARVFPAAASLLAPLWLTERGVCAWLAVLSRLRLGGVSYGDSVIRTAAHSRAELRRRASGKAPSPAPDDAGRATAAGDPRPAGLAIGAAGRPTAA